MIDWLDLLRDALWILGLAVLLAGFSYADWRRGRAQPPQPLREALRAPGFQAVFGGGMTLFCLGLALNSRPLWAIAAWGGLALLFAILALLAWREHRRRTQERDVPS